MSSSSTRLICPLCGQPHHWVPLGPGERALCLRCNTVMATQPRLGRDSTLAFSITGLIFSIPALSMPFISAGKFGQERGGLLFSSVEGLWDHDMRLLAIWVALCGTLAPMILLGILTLTAFPSRTSWLRHRGVLLSRLAHALAYWAMPEVQVLAVLVALIKLGSLVDVAIGAGFWSYAGMSFCLLVAWRNFVHRPPVPSPSDIPARPSPERA